MKTLQIPLYTQFSLTLLISKKVHKKLTKLVKEPFLPDFKGIFLTNTSDGDLVIAIDIKYLSIEVIAHEAFHAASHILRFVGIELVPESEEVYAYLLQFIVEEIVKYSKELKLNFVN